MELPGHAVARRASLPVVGAAGSRWSSDGLIRRPMKGSARRMGTTSDHHFIERMHWDEVARRVGDGALAILPIGSAAKQHGLHLPLNTDRIQAEWLAGKVAEPINALVWPTLTYGYYPAF